MQEIKYKEIYKMYKSILEELYALYSSPSIIRVIKSRRLRWQDVWHVWGRVERCTHGFSGETWGKETTWKTQA
jgi:hypothetical protein